MNRKSFFKTIGTSLMGLFILPFSGKAKKQNISKYNKEWGFHSSMSLTNAVDGKFPRICMNGNSIEILPAFWFIKGTSEELMWKINLNAASVIAKAEMSHYKTSEQEFQSRIKELMELQHKR